MNFRDRYQYDAQRDLLGKGGFSTVYKAEDKLLNRFVALKFFKNQELQKYDVLAEIRKVIQLEHPNITRYYDVATLENKTIHGEVEKVQVGVMEYINGGDIKTYLKSQPQDFDNLIKQLLEGIQYLHDNGIIHRDLKSQNILVKTQNGVATTKITDFGISKLVDSASTTTHGLLGTLAYMAPEQLDPKHFGIDGKISTNLDFWSFGILLYDLLTDSHPFIDNNSNTAEQIMRSILMGNIDSKITSIKNPVYRTMLEQCLIKDANKRVKNANELLNIKTKSVEQPITKPIAETKEKLNEVSVPLTNNESSSIQNNKGLKFSSILILGAVVIGLVWCLTFIFTKDKNANYGDTVIFSETNQTKQTMNADSLVIFTENGKSGFKDKNNNIIIKAEFERVYPFTEGFSDVVKNNKWGFIDINGTEIVPAIYDNVLYFHEGFAGVYRNTKWGFVDTTGKEVIPCIYKTVGDFSDGLADVSVTNKLGYIDKSGKQIIPFMYEYTSGFSEGLASVIFNDRCFMIDKNNNFVFELKRDEWLNINFHEDLASTKRNGKYGFVDRTGKTVIPFVYEYADDFSEGLAIIEKKGKFGYIDKKNNLVIPVIYDSTDDPKQYLFKEGFAKVSKNGHQLLIDKNGTEYPINK